MKTNLPPFSLSNLRWWPLVAVAVAAACGGSDGGDESTDAVSTGASASSPSATPRIPDVEGWLTDWSKSTIDTSELVRGIGSPDPRDQIPPIDEPAFESVGEASEWLDDREPVALFELSGEARAYPLRILTWHEIVNDDVGGAPVVITYCPLCNTALAFDRRVGGTTLTFGTSGLLRNSDLVMWDRQTESLWQQVTGEGIVGELAGEQLEFLPLTLVSWKDFREAFPEGRVLSQDTGFSRAYGNNPYEFYDSSSRPFLFSGEIDDRYPAMERVVGVLAGDDAKGYPFSVIEEERAVNDEVGSEPVVVFWGSKDTASALSDAEIPQGRAVGAGVAYSRDLGGQVLTFAPDGDMFRDEETGSTWNILGQAVGGQLAGEQLDAVIHANHLWFAWAAFYPDVEVYGE
ncbi:MAG TPA: DUF3179 domain-containing protein [Dehalococcoidia bacterium]|nr:DUF3179 domain-containing protein [Dehalococcoidia bacterium]